MQNTVHIIIVNYGSWQHTCNCLRSVFSSSYTNVKIRIVDLCNLNNSCNHLSDFLNKNDKIQSKLISIESNLGFAGANNVAIREILQTEAPGYIWLLNNDTQLINSSLEELVIQFDKLITAGQKPGFLGSILIDWHDKTTIQAVGGKFDPKNGIIKFRHQGQKNTGQKNQTPCKVDYLIGASMFCHASLVEKIGLLDESFFLYCEDIDWCYRATQTGFNNFACPSSIVYHEQGVSTKTKYGKGQDASSARRYLYSSYIKLYKKHFSKYLPVAWFQLVKLIFGSLFRGEQSEAKIIFKELFHP